MTGMTNQEITRGNIAASSYHPLNSNAQRLQATAGLHARQTVNSVPVTTVSAASYEATAVAPEAILSAFGTLLATSTQAATTIPLPTSLAGTTVMVRDRVGVDRAASLFFVSPGQINYVMPTGTAVGAASVTIQSGDGTISLGTVEVSEVAPALFTANTDGQGVPAAVALLVKTNGDQMYEPVFQPDPVSGRFITRPLDLGPEGERVFLILFLSGIRSAADHNGDKNRNETIRLVIGGEEATPSFAGAHPDFVGLDQVNAEIPRSLIGRGRVSFAISAIGFTTSNPGEVEIAASTGSSPPEVNGFSSATALAGQALMISGTGFSSNPKENLVRIAGTEASVISATPTQLSIVVPFGAETGTVSVRTPQGEGVSMSVLSVRTSISGFIENTSRSPMSSVTVKLVGTNITATTNMEGFFALPDVPAGGTKFIEIDGTSAAATALYPKVILKINVSANRDNQLARPVALQPATGAGIAVGSTGTTANESLSVSVSGNERDPFVTQTKNVTLDLPAGTTVSFPDGSTSDTLFVTPLVDDLTPLGLPPGHFTSPIVQITPFGARINPGGKLTFPNLNGFPAMAQAKIYRFDQTASSPTLGNFVEAGIAIVSPDGQRIETPTGAIKETGYYFVSIPGPTTTVIGRVMDGDGVTPVRRAVVHSLGREVITDGHGSFILRHVPVKPGDQLSVEASFLRPSGRVDRAEKRKNIAVSPSGITQVRPELVLPSDSSNRPPVILAPVNICATSGQSLDVNFVVSDPDLGATFQAGVTGAPFASIVDGADPKNKILRLTPSLSDVNHYTLTLTATDRENLSQMHSICDLKLNMARCAAIASSLRTPTRASIKWPAE